MNNQVTIAEFEMGVVRGGFHHADHVRIAFAYVSEMPLLEALAKFPAALKRFALAQGKNNLYHQTITWAYLLLIAERMTLADGAQSWEQFAESNPDLLVREGGLLERYYSRTTLDSAKARSVFVFPDAA